MFCQEPEKEEEPECPWASLAKLDVARRVPACSLSTGCGSKLNHHGTTGWHFAVLSLAKNGEEWR